MIYVECPEKEDMGTLTTEDITAATGGYVLSGDARSFSGVSTDSRRTKDGELFIALKGERFDGHTFVDDALGKCTGAIVEHQNRELRRDRTIIYVKDTLKALQDIARYIRLKRDVPVIAVTGSNGKTTTKELIASILGSDYRVLQNEGNLNNHIGLPLSLTKMSEEDEIVVLEMGASAPGEIKSLCEIAQPTCGVITNIGHAHLEGFRDIGTTRTTKLELLDYADTAVVNADDLFLMEGVTGSGFRGQLIRYGIKNPADIFATDIQLLEKGSVFNLHFDEQQIRVNPQISGMFNVLNILAAASVGRLFNIGLEGIRQAVDSFGGVPMRLEYKALDGITVISDVYNANPASMEAAIAEIVRIRKGRVIAVLGDMLELGNYQEEAHRKIGRLMSEHSVDIFIAVGPLMSVAASEFHGVVHKVKSPEEAGRLLREIWQQGDTVLIKGSRGMHMEKVLADV
jgi:UDP-N-acetylmuramoyl-tripeptide--D-alanyl-D-alanine ligase